MPDLFDPTPEEQNVVPRMSFSASRSEPASNEICVPRRQRGERLRERAEALEKTLGYDFKATLTPAFYFNPTLWLDQRFLE